MALDQPVRLPMEFYFAPSFRSVCVFKQKNHTYLKKKSRLHQNICITNSDSKLLDLKLSSIWAFFSYTVKLGYNELFGQSIFVLNNREFVWLRALLDQNVQLFLHCSLLAWIIHNHDRYNQVWLYSRAPEYS